MHVSSRTIVVEETSSLTKVAQRYLSLFFSSLRVTQKGIHPHRATVGRSRFMNPRPERKPTPISASGAHSAPAICGGQELLCCDDHINSHTIHCTLRKKTLKPALPCHHHHNHLPASCSRPPYPARQPRQCSPHELSDDSHSATSRVLSIVVVPLTL